MSFNRAFNTCNNTVALFKFLFNEMLKYSHKQTFSFTRYIVEKTKKNYILVVLFHLTSGHCITRTSTSALFDFIVVHVMILKKSHLR